MTSMGSVDALTLRRRMGREEWGVPQPFGVDGWRMIAVDGRRSVIVTAATWDGEEWMHASIAGPTMPTYDDLALLHRAVWRGGFAYQVFAPEERHVNIHEHALHLWGRWDGKNVLPDFGFLGTI